jgi:hypothetical protein
MSDLLFSEWKKMSVERWANCQKKEYAHRSKQSLNSKERAFWAVCSLSDVTKFLGVSPYKVKNLPEEPMSHYWIHGPLVSCYFFKLIIEPYVFYSFRIIFKAYCTALARQAAPPPLPGPKCLSFYLSCSWNVGCFCVDRKSNEHKRPSQLSSKIFEHTYSFGHLTTIS